ncbi:hypothetical protein D3C81_2076550 [compost metagenome]
MDLGSDNPSLVSQSVRTYRMGRPSTAEAVCGIAISLPPILAVSKLFLSCWSTLLAVGEAYFSNRSVRS